MCGVGWVKGDDIVVGFEMLGFLVFVIGEIRGDRGKREMVGGRVEGRNGVMVGGYEGGVLMKGGVDGKVVMVKCEIGLGWGIVGGK